MHTQIKGRAKILYNTLNLNLKILISGNISHDNSYIGM